MKLCDYINANKKIDTSNWKKIPLSQLFNITGTKTTSKINLKKAGEGVFPYVTTKSTNNGIDGYYNIWTEEGMVFTVDSAVAGFMTFQENNFSASDHVEKLKPLFKVNKYIADFICCIWNANKMSKKYSYILKASQNELKHDFIVLPVDKSGNPNWKYMEEFIKMRER